MPRFAVLHHESSLGSHFDLLLETGGVLRTWALPGPPEPGIEIACRALPDHRLAYLDYEGPVSGRRGTVTRWDQGTYRLLRESDLQWEIELDGTRLSSRAVLSRSSGDSRDWRFLLTDR